MTSTFVASSLFKSTLEMQFSTFYNISSKQNAYYHEFASHLSSYEINGCTFDRVCEIYDGTIIPSISTGVRSLANFNTTHISCSRWTNKHYTNETLKRIVLDPAVDKEFEFDSCTWKGIKGDGPGQCIFAKTEDETIVTLVVKDCYFLDCASEVLSGGAIFVSGNVNVKLKNTTFNDIKFENINNYAEVAAGAVHIISIYPPSIRQCLFVNCSSNEDACVIFEHSAVKIPQRKADLCESRAILRQNDCSQIRERNIFANEGKDKNRQTVRNMKSREHIGEAEPICFQSIFMSCISKRNGGGLLLENVEECVLVSECDFSGCQSRYGEAILFRFSNIRLSDKINLSSYEYPYCVFASYFAINFPSKNFSNVLIQSRSDYDDGLRFFSLCKASREYEKAAVQVIPDEHDTIIPLLKSFDVAQRVIVLDSTAKFDAACGSSASRPCQTVHQALNHVALHENVKFSIYPNSQTIVDEVCTVDNINLEIAGKQDSVMVISKAKSKGYYSTVFILASTVFSLRELTVLYSKSALGRYCNVFLVEYRQESSTILADHVLFKCESKDERSDINEKRSDSHEKDSFTDPSILFDFFTLTNLTTCTITGCEFSYIPAGSMRNVIGEWDFTRVTVIDTLFYSIDSQSDFPIFAKLSLYHKSSLEMRNVTANVINSNSKAGGFLSMNVSEHSGIGITNSSFVACTATEYAGALDISVERGASLVFNELYFLINEANKYHDMILFARSLLDVNFQTIFSFVDKTIDGSKIGCFDSLYYQKGISVEELLTVLLDSTIYVSSSRGTDFTRCGPRELPCRSLTYGWTHLKWPFLLNVIDLTYLTQPVTLNAGEISSSSEMGMVGKVEVNIEYSGSWEDVIFLNGGVAFTGLNLVLSSMTNKTKNAITIADGASMWKDMIISFSTVKEEQSVSYVLYNVIKGSLILDNLTVNGGSSLITRAMFIVEVDVDLLQLKNVSIENVRVNRDLIFVAYSLSCNPKKMNEQNVQNILVSNFSCVKTDNQADSVRSSQNADETIVEGRFLRSRESTRQKLELHNSSFSGFVCPDNFEPYGGCIHWSEKKQDGKGSSTTSENDEAEESSELLLKNCTFCHDGLDTQLREKETKGGAIYLAFDSSTFPFVFQDVCLFENKANTGSDIFFRCASIMNKDESKKFGINFHYPLWREQNSIAAESEEDGKTVDYLVFVAYRNVVVYVSGFDVPAKKHQTGTISSSSLSSFWHSSNDNSLNSYRKAAEQVEGWDIFFCGDEDNPCHTVNYAMAHLSYQPSEDEDEQLTIRVIGEPSLYFSVTWKSLLVEGRTEDAGLLLDYKSHLANEQNAFGRTDGQREGDELIDTHVVIEGKCMLNKTNVKVSADLPVNYLFFISNEGTFVVEKCTVASAKKQASMPTVFKIESGSLSCYFVRLDEVLFNGSTCFIDCSQLEDERKANVRLKNCSLTNIKQNDKKSLVLYSLKEKRAYESSAHQHFTESTSLLVTTSSSISSNISSLPQTSSSSHSNLNTSPHDEKSSIPLRVPLQFIGTNVSLTSRMLINGFFLTASGCSCAEITGCSFLYVSASSSADNMQKDNYMVICFWSTSFLNFVDCSVYVRNTKFRTKLEGAIYSENSYLSIDPESLKGNSVELEAFPSVAHNIICKSDTSQENDDKGTIELVKGTGSSTIFESKVRSMKPGIRTQNGLREEKINEELPDNFWIANTNCTLVGFPSDMMSSMLTPRTENASLTKIGEVYEVTLTGKCLVHCFFSMVILVYRTINGNSTSELLESKLTTNLDCSFENTITGYFPKDIFERSDGAAVYAALTFSDLRSLNKNMTTVPLLICEGKETEEFNERTMIIIIVTSSVFAAIAFAVILLLVRRLWKKKVLVDEFKEKQSLLSSINSSIPGKMERGKDGSVYSSYVYDYGTTTKPIDVPLDMQEPFLED
ncbi:uncharacterized protein MONOS_12155 [Monocercomonoides exilis]|uniref:uncharacterized protein n=1 Tax=Monocercomonoides exilis TaxID=2049356 RepID=UPI00355A1348|nr:hypothetical protein MONOS_12155 [Monocercomonoides exilis]|eukprot:MONOS_12155.1-p1 / transcript=MONOS_12155.1 / gene=MONOS_12155 / organism=Monocercomonoides_exilis_PA203 / gene_product=unspecified product / transcript_product=unspecified product / location=Mono_scaffold00653:29167-34926(+) / protein_length=1920 / sequence_SO=supercontig / SO=protein_coding / is_pseudo=false